MAGNFRIMFLLYTFVLPADASDPVMSLVKVCPKNEHDVMQASKTLGCDYDRYGNNQYMCLPNKNKTSLVEFCYQGVMGIVEKENCLEFSEGYLIHHSCNHFLEGCPETHFFDNDIYKYPACQNINSELQCYVMDPNCTAQSNTKKSSGQNNVILIVSIGILVLFIIGCIIIIFLCYTRRRATRNKRRMNSEYDDGKVNDESETPLTEKRGEEKINAKIAKSLSEEGQEKVADKSVTSLSDTSRPASSKMPIAVKNETVESLLHRLRMDNYIEAFREHDIDLNLLLELSESDLKDTLRDMNLPIGTRHKIKLEIKAMKSRIEFWRENEIKIVLIGKDGNEKSATGYTILGRQLNHSGVSGSSVTNSWSQKSAVRFDQKINIINTPDIFDKKRTNEEIQKETPEYISILSPGPHAFILVLDISRYTEDEVKSIQNFVESFGENVFKFLIVLLTTIDDSDIDEKCFDYTKCLHPSLQELFAKCGKNVITFNNKLQENEGDEQVENLLSMIMVNVNKNNGECYKNEMYIEAEVHQHEETEWEATEQEKEREHVFNTIRKDFKRARKALANVLIEQNNASYW